MKKYIFGLILFLVISCNNANQSVNSPSDKSPKGKVAFTFKNSAQNKISANVDPTNVRVLIRRFQDDVLKFNALADVQVPTDTTIVVSVPAQNNYQIDAFSYIDSTSIFKPILKVDQVTDISVSADAVTQVSLTLKPISANFSIPDTVTKGDNFNISATFNSIFGIPKGYNTQYLAYIYTDSLYSNNFINMHSDFYDTYSSDNRDPNLNWGGISFTNFGGKYGYFQVVSKIAADEYYKENESKFSFVFNYPNLMTPDTLKTFVKLPEGGIGVVVTY